MYFSAFHVYQIFHVFFQRTVEVIDGPKFTPQAQKKKAQKSRRREIWITWVTLTFQGRKQKKTNDSDAMISGFCIGCRSVQLLKMM